MLDGTYQVLLRSPMGPRQGTLILESLDDGLGGTLEMLGFKNDFQGGSLDGEAFSITMDIHTLLGERQIKVCGRCTGEELLGTIHMSAKEIPFAAIRQER